MAENQKGPGRGSPPVTPRWVKLFVIVFVLIILLIVILHLMGLSFGGHGLTSFGKVFSVEIGPSQL